MNETMLNRFNSYDKDYCWQYHIRQSNLEEDLKLASISKEEMESLSIDDFEFKQVESKTEQGLMKKFIERHEWLGNTSQYPTHWFGAYYKGILAGVLIFNMPNAFSKLLGEETNQIERLISRGACISWSPKCLASSFLMWSIRWMVENTQYRLFTAYSDPMAKEIGTIYQACNFYYLGKKSGTNRRYINPYSGKIVSDRFFRQRSAYRRYARDLGIPWNKNWISPTKMLWDNVPDGIETRLREYSKEIQSKSTVIEFPSKHKYAFVLGKDRRETRQLRKEFESRNKIYPYPKDR